MPRLLERAIVLGCGDTSVAGPNLSICYSSNCYVCSRSSCVVLRGLLLIVLLFVTTGFPCLFLQLTVSSFVATLAAVIALHCFFVLRLRVRFRILGTALVLRILLWLLVLPELGIGDHCCCSIVFRRKCIYLDLLINKDLSKSRLVSIRLEPKHFNCRFELSW